MKIGAELKIAVTGTDTFRYISVSPGDNKVTMVQTELGARAPDDHEVSTDYTCHVWTKDTNQLLICTAEGDMLLCNHGGEFIRYIPDSGNCIAPNRIDSITAYSRGVIAAGEDGLIWAFEGSTSDEAPYRLQQDPIDSKKRDESVCKYIETENINIVSLILNNTEDTLYYIDRQNQLLKYAIQLDGTDIETEKSSYVSSPFHKQEITGMDICLRKQLVATCSKRFINIWNYADRRLDIQYMCPPGDELKAIALHPSGFHLVVAIGDNIKFFNILSETIAEYPPSFQLKSCQEIKFSHGGHLFACAVG